LPDQLLTSHHRALAKVTAYITQGQGELSRLLIFRHPNAGLQLPAGTVEVGESVEAAAHREALEETGLAGLRLIRYLGAQSATLAPDIRAVIRPSKLFDAPAPDASTTGVHLQRGRYLHFIQPIGPYAEVRTEDDDAPDAATGGFVRQSVLTSQLERHHFHFVFDRPTGDTWQVATDNRLFTLFWAPLRRELGLEPPQDTWLAFAYDELVASVAALAG
jgi:8-oxo-dGTP pyrophosphatase MutT (NUDIX family)